MEYGEALETINDGEYAICEKALSHFLPELNKFITSGWRFGDPDAEMELEKKYKRLNLDAQK